MGAGETVRILSLSGGGYLGLFTATALATLESRVGEPIGRRFDLIAGTSVGGILAIGLAYEVPMRRMAELFVNAGREVFSSRALPTGLVGRVRDMSRSVLAPKYSGKALRELLTQALGERTLGDALHDIAIPAIDVTCSRTKIFKTRRSTISKDDSALHAVDVAMATCAAPTYFPSVSMGGALYSDGGMFAVAPDQVALHEVEHFLGVSRERVRMLSVGTATSDYQPVNRAKSNDGAAVWLSDARLLLTLVSAQQHHVKSMMQDQLGDHYLRIDASWPADAGLGIDVATPKVSQTLVDLAKHAVEMLDPVALDVFLRAQ